MLDEEEPKFLLAGASLLALLGIHYSQFPEAWEIVERQKRPETEGQTPLIVEGKYVKGLSGMTCVLPAWRIREVLDLPPLKTLRAKIDAHWAEKFRQEGFPPEMEAAGPPATDENSTHQEDFTAAKNAAQDD